MSMGFNSYCRAALFISCVEVVRWGVLGDYPALRGG